MKKFLVLLLLIIFAFTSKMAAIASTIPQGTKALIRLDKSYTGKELNEGDQLTCKLVNDVKVDNKTIIKSNSQGYILVKKARNSQFAGGRGIIELENGFIFSNGIKYSFNFSETINGKQKNWVRLAMVPGIIILPFLCIGFVKGGQAKIHENKIFEVELSGDNYKY